MYADVDVKTRHQPQASSRARGCSSPPAPSPPPACIPCSGYSWELKMPEGVQIVDGADNIRRAVREQVKYGADWIKYYSDRRYFMKDGVLHSWVNFTDEEARAIVDEAHRLGRKVAAHAMGRDGIDRRAARRRRHHRARRRPGRRADGSHGASAASTGARPSTSASTWPRAARRRGPHLADDGRSGGAGLRQGGAKGVKIAYGTDAGGYAWTENQAKEFAYMVRYGMTPMQAIQSATTVAAALLDQQDELGRHRGGQARRHRGGGGRSLAGHHGAGARPVRDEGRAGL